MAEFLDKTGLNSLWKRIKEALPFKTVSITGNDNGWLKIAQVHCATTYMNTPIVFHLICRGFPATSVELMLLSQNGTTPGVKYFVHRTTLLEGSHGTSSNVGYTYSDVDGVRTYTLWKKKNERYGSINVHAECANDWAKYISYDTGISYTEPEGIVYADERYDNVKKQTVYTEKGSATKIPIITTNAAGQVVLIDEEEIGNAPTATNPLATKLTSSNDLNNIKGDGRGVWWYYWDSASVPANAHATSATAYMEVVRMHTGNYLFQTVYEANSAHLYRRQCRNGTWDAWYRYAKASTTLSGYGITNAYTKTEVDGLLDDKLDTDGDGSSLTETFTAASSRANIASGDSNATIFGKIAKWLGDLKALAFKDKVGTGDVESGTYGISVSGNAATASAAQSGSALETAINGKYTKPSGGIPKTDLASAVQTSLGKADTALQTHQDITTKLNIESFDFDPDSTSSIKNWNALTRNAVVNIEHSQGVGVNGSPESGRINALTLVSDGYIVQMAFGNNIYYREKPSSGTFTDWRNVVTSNSIKKIVKDTVIGTDADVLYVLI